MDQARACAKGRSVEFSPFAGCCPHCTGEALARYVVLSEGGWFHVLKCRSCLTSLERVPAGLHGPLARDAFAAVRT